MKIGLWIKLFKIGTQQSGKIKDTLNNHDNLHSRRSFFQQIAKMATNSNVETFVKSCMTDEKPADSQNILPSDSIGPDSATILPTNAPSLKPEFFPVVVDLMSVRYCHVSTSQPLFTNKTDGFGDITGEGNAISAKPTFPGSSNRVQLLSRPVYIYCGSGVSGYNKAKTDGALNRTAVLDAISDPKKTVIVSVSPGVHIALSEMFSITQRQLIGAIRALGADYVVDATFGADLRIIEQAAELQQRIISDTLLPQFSISSAAWIKFVEMHYPDLLPRLTTVKSPAGIQGTVLKTHFAAAHGINPSQIVHLAVMSDTDKQYNGMREEITAAGYPCVDDVISPLELASIFKSKEINFMSENGVYDNMMGQGCSTGAMLGNTGGVTQAVLRTVYYNLTGSTPPISLINWTAVKGMPGVREAKVEIGKVTVYVAVVDGINSVCRLLAAVASGTTHYHFVEVLSGTEGCVEAIIPSKEPIITMQQQINSIYNYDDNSIVRYCHENPEIKAIYGRILEKPGSDTAKVLLHNMNKPNSVLP